MSKIIISMSGGYKNPRLKLWKALQKYSLLNGLEEIIKIQVEGLKVFEKYS